MQVFRCQTGMHECANLRKFLLKVCATWSVGTNWSASTSCELDFLTLVHFCLTKSISVHSSSQAAIRPLLIAKKIHQQWPHRIIPNGGSIHMSHCGPRTNLEPHAGARFIVDSCFPRALDADIESIISRRALLKGTDTLSTFALK